LTDSHVGSHFLTASMMGHQGGPTDNTEY